MGSSTSFSISYNFTFASVDMFCLFLAFVLFVVFLIVLFYKKQLSDRLNLVKHIENERMTNFYR